MSKKDLYRIIERFL